MLKLFRDFMNSKLGVGITLAVLVVIALAFAVGDVANTGTFGGIAGGDRVAVVGKRKISTSELESAARAAFDQMRRNNPTATMEGFLANGGFEDVVERLIDRTAIAEFAKQNGLRAGDRLIDSEIVQIPAFAGADGKFDENAYKAAIRAQGLTDQQVRDDLGSGLLIRQAVSPVVMNPLLPAPLVQRYAALLKERRHGEIGLLLSDAFAPKGNPTDAQIQAFHAAHKAQYMQPERRVIRYATFGAEAVKNLAAPTEAEIAARYKRDSALYAATEKRKLTQLVVPTDAAAKAILDEVAKGKSLDAAAREKGLAVTGIGPLSQADLASQASTPVAQAAFATAQGKLSAPARGALGFYVMRVDAVERVAGRSIDQVRKQIADALTAEKRAAAIADLSAKVEDEFDDGSSLAEVAQSLGIAVQTTPELIGNGAVYKKQGETAPTVLARALPTAFDMDEGEPQLTEIEPGKTFLVFEVAKVVPAAAAPIAEIREPLIAAWRRAEGDKLAKQAADRVMQRVAKGETVAAAFAKEGVPLPPIEKVNMDRQDLARLGQRVPPVFALFFSMAEGTVKRLEAPNDNGWFVVRLDDIEPGKLEPSDPVIARAAQQLGQSVGDEYGAQITLAIRDAVGVERNEAAIKAVKARLTGKN